MRRTSTYVCFDCRISSRDCGHLSVCPECKQVMTELNNFQNPPKKNKKKLWNILANEIISERRHRRQALFFRCSGFRLMDRKNALKKFNVILD